ncbi:hypothetical protein GCM10025868_12460 [Angustibacter aerolatus]|uniref:Uncharacterized protein n=1 Tax=Angustibacter aerolatus TaxID=1162965 RepID=A0ABQ6JEI0_9ACTN|nr:hypothetical protein GCM10025868_12460 [Angustibacter aerolatus]
MVLPIPPGACGRRDRAGSPPGTIAVMRIPCTVARLSRDASHGPWLTARVRGGALVIHRLQPLRRAGRRRRGRRGR